MSSRSRGGRKRLLPHNVEEAAADLLNHVAKGKPRIPILVALFFIAFAIHRWLVSFSNCLLLALAVWTTLQYGSYQRKQLEENLDKKWRRIMLNNAPVTPLEHCEWLNKLLTEIWPKYFNPKLSRRLLAIVEKRLKLRKPRLIERVELQEFSLGSCPPTLGLQGMRWSTSGDQRILTLGLDWDTSDMSVLMVAKLAIGTARIVINSLHINGKLLVTPILDGKALLYSFLSAPEVKIGISIGSGGIELPGVSSWLEKLFTDTLVKTMVEPRRRCLSLPVVDFRKKAVGGIIYVTVISANKLSRSCFKGTPSKRQQNGTVNGCLEDSSDDEDLQTFVEVEVEELTRRTSVSRGSTPKWDATFNMVLHDNTGIVHFNLYECPPSDVKYDYLASCEIKMRHVEDDSTIMWAEGPDSGVIAARAKFCGDEIEMIVPFEEASSGELMVRIVVKEWQFADGSHGLNNLGTSSQPSLSGSSNLQSKTGRKLKITVVEAKDLTAKDKREKFNPYIKLQYGKAIQRTRIARTPNPVWNQSFEFDEMGGDEYLSVKCFTEEFFGDEDIGSAHVNLDGLVDGSIKDVWIPLEGVSSGELRLKIEAVRVVDPEGSRGSALGSCNGWIELVLIEAKDLVAADLGGTSDPYVRVDYGNLKKRTKVIHKTLHPRWNQTLEFLDDGSPLLLRVKDHNAVLPTSSIGECVVDYQRLPPNQMSDKWIPLQGVKSGEIHIQVTRKVPEIPLRQVLGSDALSLSKLHQIPSQHRTRGLVIWRSGSFMLVYRGSNYEGPVPISQQNGSVLRTEESSDPVVRNQEQPENMTPEEAEFDRMLDGLGPRFVEWWGMGILPVDADLLPPTVPGYKTPLRLLPTGTRPRLTDAELTNMRKLSKSLPCHFALSRNRNHQGLACAILKLWEESLVVKIAVKRGVQNTNNELMAEELKKLTGGTLLLRNKYFIVIYRGNDFVPTSVAAVLAERQELTKQVQEDEEKMRSKAVDVTPSGEDEATAQVGSLTEFYEAQARWGRDISTNEREKMMKEAAKAKNAKLVEKIERKLALAQSKRLRAEKLLAKIEASLLPAVPDSDQETITDEERAMFRRVGLIMKPYLPVGIRGVFDGVIENMHLHWKHRELVKLITKQKTLAFVEDTARLLEYESGGILVSIDRLPKGFCLIYYRGKNYRPPITIKPRNLLTKAKALKRAIAMQRHEALSQHIIELGKKVEEMKKELGLSQDLEPEDRWSIEDQNQRDHISELTQSELEGSDNEENDGDFDDEEDS